MTSKQINRGLYLCVALLLAASIAVAVAGARLPLSTGAIEPSSGTHSATTRPAGEATLGANAFETIVSSKWRRPLRDEPAPAASAPQPEVKQTTEQLPVTLVGTVGTSLAMLQKTDGNVEVKAVGESTSGIKVLAVRPSQVDVEYNGRKLTLQRSKEAGATP